MEAIADVRRVPLNHLKPSKQQARTREITKDLQDLVNNIRVHGQLEPILVSPVGDGDSMFQIIAGQRRWLAMKELGLGSALCAVLRRAPDETTARVLSLSENLVRRELESLDLIDACTFLYQKYGSIKAVSQELGLPYARVRAFVKFERLRPELKCPVKAGELDVKAALRIEDYLGQESPEPEVICELVRELACMTNAQQVHYLRQIGPRGVAGSAPPGSRPTEPESRGMGSPGAVHQVIVTLSKEAHYRLRQWAAGQKITQDNAGARIINDFLDARPPAH